VDRGVNQLLPAVLLFTSLSGACVPAASCGKGEPGSQQDSLQPARSERQQAKTEVTPPRPPPSFVAIPVDDPSGTALDKFYEALREAEAHKGQARILIYGASHTAADVYPDILRRRLQARFGDAGTGFVMPAKPQRHYSIPGIGFESSIGWTGYHVKTSTLEVDHYGLAGQYLEPSGRRVRSVFNTRPHGGLSGTATDLELFYWKQPGGGRLKVTIDGKATDINTAGKAGAAYRRWSVADEHHRVELSTKNGDSKVRVFGMSIERDAPGVVIDTLGIPGARASTQLFWGEALQREHMQRRRPNLVILAYGTNESGDDDQPIEDFAANLRKVIMRIRLAVPDASCLLIGPSDRPLRVEDGAYVDRPRTAQVVATQREVSFELGCGFFDLVSFMGGPMSMMEWCEGEPPWGASDHVHFTQRGYQALGNVLHDALLDRFDHPPALIGGENIDGLPDAAAAAARVEAADAGTPVVSDASTPSASEPEPPVSGAPRGSRRSSSSKPGSTYRR
jgi:lysophospholipase L1-like esterase